MKVLRKAALLLLVSTVLPNCRSLAPSRPVGHAVFLWLKKPGDQAMRRQALAAGEALRAIPGLRSLQLGECLPSPRPIVDSTYDVGFFMSFDTPEAMNAYLTHPLHVKAANEVLKPLARRIQVYDFR
jgi:hypothetical protein